MWGDVGSEHTPPGIGLELEPLATVAARYPQGYMRGGNVIREVDVATLAAAQCAGAFVVDVREPGEYLRGHVPGARLIPMGEVRARLAELPKDRPVHVICASGNRSHTVAGWLVAAGIDACSVAGGTQAWIRAGRPVARGPHADSA